MDWRLVMRRCPSRSMTLVGDIAQTSAAGGASSWRDALAPHVADRWRLAELTVNYRTPAEIMRVAAKVLAELDPELQPPTSVRESGVEPWEVELAPDRHALPQRIAELVDGELAAVAAGTVAVIGPKAIAGRLRREITGERVSVLTVDDAKGLEFDAVVVVDPDGIIAASPRGRSDLYVALTRATQRLGVVRV